MKPPSGGPSSGPISAGIVTQAMALTSSRLSTVRTSTSRPTGVIIAPPMPCTMRATTNCAERARQRAADRAEHEDGDRGAEHGARAEAVGDPAAGRDEDREREQVGGDRELQRRAGSVPMSAAIAGSEVAITVESMFSMNSAHATISGTRRSGVMGGHARIGLSVVQPIIWHERCDGWRHALANVLWKSAARGAIHHRQPKSGP